MQVSIKRKRVIKLANATNVKVVRKIDKEGNVEPFEFMLRRFKKAYQESGVLADVRKHEFAMSKSQKRAEKRKRAEKLRRIEEAKQMEYTPKEF